MANDEYPVEVRYSTQLRRDLKRLSKKYRGIKSDLNPVFEAIQCGETPGDRITGTSDYYVYKARVPNRDVNKGKSGGYRMIYQIKETFFAILLTIYSKSDQPDISTAEILRIIEEEDSSEE